MFVVMAAQIFIQAAFLCLILYLVARHEADYGFQKVAMVSGGIMVGTLLIEALAAEKLGALVFVPQIAFIAFMLMTFCWITFGKSIVVVILFSLIHVGFSLGAAALKEKYFGPGDGPTPASMAEQRMIEAQEEMLKTLGQLPEDGSLEDLGATETKRVKRKPPAKPRRPPAREPARRKAVPPDDPDAMDERTAWTEARRQLRIGGVMSSGQGRIVTIDGKLREKGDVVKTVCAGYEYRWRVGAVGDDGPELTQMTRKPGGE